MDTTRARSTRHRRQRYGTDVSLKAAVRTIPARPSLELFGTIHTPKEFKPLLRPDGPFFGSGV